MFVSIFTSLLSFQIMAVMLPLTLVLMSPHFSLRFFLNFCGMHFQFSLTVLQQFMVLVCKLTDKSGGKKELAM